MIKNMNELKSNIDKCIISALEQTRLTIGRVLLNKVSDYYNEYEPLKYERTWNLLDSLASESQYSLDNGKVTKTKDGYGFRVGWDNSYLNFHYKAATGRMVLERLDNETHGGWRYDNNGNEFEHRFFTEAIEELGGEDGVKNLFKQNYISLGLPIK